MTILDCCISLKMVKKNLVVLGVVDMGQLLLTNNSGVIHSLYIVYLVKWNLNLKLPFFGITITVKGSLFLLLNQQNLPFYGSKNGFPHFKKKIFLTTFHQKGNFRIHFDQVKYSFLIPILCVNSYWRIYKGANTSRNSETALQNNFESDHFLLSRRFSRHLE